MAALRHDQSFTFIVICNLHCSWKIYSRYITLQPSERERINAAAAAAEDDRFILDPYLYYTNDDDVMVIKMVKVLIMLTAVMKNGSHGHGDDSPD